MGTNPTTYIDKMSAKASVVDFNTQTLRTWQEYVVCEHG